MTGSQEIRRLCLARPRGFCAGVRRALKVVDRALERYGPPVYVRHEIVHNRTVVEDLMARGVVFVEDLHGVPPARPLIFSAHGVAPDVEAEARARGLSLLIDAACPLVCGIHRRAARHRREGRTVLIVGHRGHPEVVATLGHAGPAARVVESAADVVRLPDDLGPLACVTQTTLSQRDVAEAIDAIRRRYGERVVWASTNVCYASESRQKAVQTLACLCPVILVVGSPTSSNSRRLVEIAAAEGARAHLVEDRDAIDPGMVPGSGAVGISAGASAPERTVAGLVAFFRERGWPAPEEIGQDEPVRTFQLPSFPDRHDSNVS